MVLHGARCYRVSHSVTADVSPFLCVWATPGLWCAVASLEIQLLIAAFENKQERISAILTHRMHTSNNARKPSGFTAFLHQDMGERRQNNVWIRHKGWLGHRVALLLFHLQPINRSQPSPWPTVPALSKGHWFVAVRELQWGLKSWISQKENGIPQNVILAVKLWQLFLKLREVGPHLV